MRVGEVDGHGRYGMVDDDGHTLGCCHHCDRRVRNLGLHCRVHGHTAVSYRRAHGLSTGQRLIPADLAEQLGRLARSHPNGLTALAAHRDPDRARAAMTAEGQSRPQRAAVRSSTGAMSRRGRDLAQVEIQALVAAGTDLGAWAKTARGILAAGATAGSIARGTGLTRNAVHARISRYR